MPHTIINTACGGLDSHPARTKVKVEVDVTVQKLEREEIRLQPNIRVPEHVTIFHIERTGV
jgi:hypothetical protein